MRNVIFILFFILSLISCDNSYTENRPINSGVLINDKDILKAREDLIRGMLSYIENADVSYTRADVVEIEITLNEHYKKLNNIKTETEADLLVKDTVIKLNHLNYKANHELIETDQRELICEFIIRSGAMHGFNKQDEDITEEWREW